MVPSDIKTTSATSASRIRITISKDKLTAMMAISAAPEGATQVELEDVHQALKEAGVVHGIDANAIEAAINDKLFDTPVKVAEGTSPSRGNDASFTHTYNTASVHKPEEGEDGHIDYRNIDFIQNTTKGTVLVRKIPATDGTSGTAVDGSESPAPRGRDLPFSAGENTVPSEDGTELLANADGAVVCRNNTVSVQEVLTIKGDIDFNVGNINAVGSVKVTGSIKAGFTVKVGGNLEVNGNVEDCTVEVKGDVLVRGGCFGAGKGRIKAEGDVLLKFAESYQIVSGQNVTVGGELLNCQVMAAEQVLVKGRGGKIVGGDVRAGKEIRAAVLGSDASTPTVLKVAYNAELMKRYKETIEEADRLKADEERVRDSLLDLVRLQLRDRLPPDKVPVMKQLEQFKKSVPKELEKLEEERESIQEQMQELKEACIIADDTIYPGVQAHFGIVYREVSDALRHCRLTIDGNRILISDLKGGADSSSRLL